MTPDLLDWSARVIYLVRCEVQDYCWWAHKQIKAFSKSLLRHVIASLLHFTQTLERPCSKHSAVPCVYIQLMCLHACASLLAQRNQKCRMQLKAHRWLADTIVAPKVCTSEHLNISSNLLPLIVNHKKHSKCSCFLSLARSLSVCVRVGGHKCIL